ncbi:hypothetical protein N9Y92_04475, partial [Chlamydiales bacterium]|nr:hypothetical protein [Chlamydiales bacterium]
MKKIALFILSFCITFFFLFQLEVLQYRSKRFLIKNIEQTMGLTFELDSFDFQSIFNWEIKGVGHVVEVSIDPWSFFNKFSIEGEVHWKERGDLTSHFKLYKEKITLDEIKG